MPVLAHRRAGSVPVTERPQTGTPDSLPWGERLIVGCCNAIAFCDARGWVIAAFAIRLVAGIWEEDES